MPQSAWTVDDSRRLYNLSTWGDGYFDITAQGELAVGGDADHRVALPEIVEQLATAGLRLPVLLTHLSLSPAVICPCGSKKSREKLV